MRGKGVASTLLAKVISDSNNEGNKVLWLRIMKGSEAEKLYLRMGFKLAYYDPTYRLAAQETKDQALNPSCRRRCKP